MNESEQAVHARADHGDDLPRRVCSQLVTDQKRYGLWIVRQDIRMRAVAERRRREQQLLALRAVAVEQVHRTALVRYLRECNVTGARRDQTMLTFYGVVDPRRSVLSEHKNYLLAASNQWCALDVLELAGDGRGVKMIENYEQSYGQFFSLFCERARAAQNGKQYVLAALVPEARAQADRLRDLLLGGHLLPRGGPGAPHRRTPVRPGI